MSASPEITLIIPQYNRADLTLRCLESLHRSESATFQTLIVDDGSHPEELRRLQQRHDPDTQIIRQSHAGTTAAWNLGLRRATTPLLVFLNNDIESRGEWIAALVAPLRNQQALMTGVAWRREQQLPAAVRDHLATDRFLSGWCFAIRRPLLLQLGGFNPRLQLYFSDTDLQCRLLRHAVGVDPRQAVANLPLAHQGHQTTHTSPTHRIVWREDREQFTRDWSRIIREKSTT